MAGGWQQLWNDPPPPAGITNNTFTGPQDLSAGTTGTVYTTPVIPNNIWKQSQAWRMTAMGTYSVTGTPTLVFGIYVASNVLQVAAPSITASTGVTTMNWSFTATGIVRTTGNGTVATMLWSGQLQYAVTSNTASPTILPMWQAPMAVGSGFDSTATAGVKMFPGATFGASSASNIVVLHGLLIEWLN